jgi:hypothetical protein
MPVNANPGPGSNHISDLSPDLISLIDDQVEREKVHVYYGGRSSRHSRSSLEAEHMEIDLAVEFRALDGGRLESKAKQCHEALPGAATAVMSDFVRSLKWKVGPETRGEGVERNMIDHRVDELKKLVRNQDKSREEVEEQVRATPFMNTVKDKARDIANSGTPWEYLCGNDGYVGTYPRHGPYQDGGSLKIAEKQFKPWQASFYTMLGAENNDSPWKVGLDHHAHWLVQFAELSGWEFGSIATARYKIAEKILFKAFEMMNLCPTALELIVLYNEKDYRLEMPMRYEERDYYEPRNGLHNAGINLHNVEFNYEIVIPQQLCHVYTVKLVSCAAQLKNVLEHPSALALPLPPGRDEAYEGGN